MTFLAKLKSSLALDRDRRRVQVHRNAKDEFTLLEDRLRNARPVGEIDSDLHFSIMRAVRSADNERIDPVHPGFQRWAAIPAVTACLALCIWWLASRPASNVEFVAQMDVQPMIAVTFDHGRELTQKAPDAALAPLVGEMELLSRDVQSAVDLVVATMPGAATSF